MHQVVSIQRLNHYYQEGRKKKQVLFDIDFEINSQEVVILTGESGSGKTTLLSLIGCLRSVQHGNLNVLGQELNGVSEVQRIKIRRRIGYVFQHFNLLEFMTVLQNVMLSLELQDNYDYQDAVVLATEILDAVGLKRQMHMYPRDLSGGQKQRVAIARSLVHRPPLLLADEPTSALDRRTGREVIELITDLAQIQGSAVLIVTHDSRIFNITNRLIRMEDGYLNLAYQERLSLVLPTLSDKQLIQLSPKLEILTFLPGENIIRQGEVADKFYILLEGEVEVIQESPDGEIHVLKTLKPNHFFGEVGLLYKALRIATVRATRYGVVKVIVVSDQEFNKILADSDMTQALLEQRASQILTANLYQLYASDKIKKNDAKFMSYRFEPGQLIIDKGDLLVAVYVVLEGAAVLFERTDISCKIVKTFYPLDYFGAIDIITRRKSSCRICADPNTGASLLIVDRSAFQALYLSSNTAPLQFSPLDLISDNTLSGNIEDDL